MLDSVYSKNTKEHRYSCFNGDTGQANSGGGPTRGGGGSREFGNAAGGHVDNPRGLPTGPIRAEDYQQYYRDTVQSLTQLQQQLHDDSATSRDIQGLLRDLHQLDPNGNGYSNDPMLAERIQAAMAGLEQVEMELRRKVDASGTPGTVRSPGNETVPQGYQDAVAQYFRKLSGGK